MRASLTAALALFPAFSDAYWLMSAGVITEERLDPIIAPNAVSGHVHTVFGGNNFASNITTAKLQQSACSSTAVNEDMSAYWAPKLYFQWKNGSFSDVVGEGVIYYFFADTSGTTKAFPDNFRMISGDLSKRTFDPNDAGQKAVLYNCIQSNGPSTDSTGLPEKECSFSLRSQLFFPNCWDGKNLDSPNHKSHVAFPKVDGISMPPNSGQKCEDPNFPVVLPQVLLEIWWQVAPWYAFKGEAMNPEQPFVYAYGDPTGFGNHGDFFNGWKEGVLQKAVDGCNCNIDGDPSCCVQKGIFTTTDPSTKKCVTPKSSDEQVTGVMAKLPGNNPVVGGGGTVSPPPVNSAQPPASSPYAAPVPSSTPANEPATSLPVYLAPAPSPSPSDPLAAPAPVTTPSPIAGSPAVTPPANPESPPASYPGAPSTGACKPKPPGLDKSKHYRRRRLEQGMF